MNGSVGRLGMLSGELAMTSDLSCGWRLESLGGLILIHHGCAFKGEFFADAPPGDILLTPGNFAVGGGFKWGKRKYYRGPVATDYVLQPGELLISMTDLSKAADTLGSPAVVPKKAPSESRLLHNQRLGRVEIVKPDRVHRGFLYWVLRTEQYRRQIVASATGTTVKHTSPTKIRETVIPLPPIDEQIRIAMLLNSLDDKIDSNQLLATLLEEAVAVVFRARFVDFVGIESLKTSEIGLLPCKWELGRLTDIAEFVNGKAFTKHANGVGLPILRIKELKVGVNSATPWGDIETDDKHMAKHGDILFAWSGSLGVYRWSGPEALINQHVFKVIPAGYPAWFVFGWIQQHMPEFQGIARDKATTMGHIQRRHLTEATVPIPDSEALARACEDLAPLDMQHSVLMREIRSLIEIRDALLPRLISGRIRLPDTADPDEASGAFVDEAAGS